MLSTIGKPLRSALFRRLSDRFPSFTPIRAQRVPGFTWDFESVVGPDLVFRLTFQRHKYDNSFTLEFAWAERRSQLDAARHVDARQPLSGSSGVFRVGALWSGTGDYWWKVTPGGITGVQLGRPDQVEGPRAPAAPLPSDVSSQIEASVDDAIMRLDTALWPVMAKLAEDRGYVLKRRPSE